MLATRPVLVVGVIRADHRDSQRLIALLLALCWFVWQHRLVFLELAENINQAFEMARVGWQVWIEMFEFVLWICPVGYGPG